MKKSVFYIRLELPTRVSFLEMLNRILKIQFSRVNVKIPGRVCLIILTNFFLSSVEKHQERAGNGSLWIIFSFFCSCFPSVHFPRFFLLVFPKSFLWVVQMGGKRLSDNGLSRSFQGEQFDWLIALFTFHCTFCKLPGRMRRSFWDPIGYQKPCLPCHQRSRNPECQHNVLRSWMQFQSFVSYF